MLTPANVWAASTLIVNVLGCVALAALSAYAARRPLAPLLQLFAGTGFVGPFTTLSTVLLLFTSLERCRIHRLPLTQRGALSSCRLLDAHVAGPTPSSPAGAVVIWLLLLAGAIGAMIRYLLDRFASCNTRFGAGPVRWLAARNPACEHSR